MPKLSLICPVPRLTAGPAIPSVGYPKRSQTTTADNEHKEDTSAQPRKSSSSGSRGMAPPSPLLGNANNPNKADIPDRKKGSTAPGVSYQLLSLSSEIAFFLI